MVCNGDVLTTLDLDALVAFHDARGAEATIYLTQVDDPSAFGVVPTRADGEVVAFVEKPPKGVAPTNWINGGTYVLEPSVLERIPDRLDRLDRARDVPAHAGGAEPPLRDGERRATGSTSGRPRSTCRRTPTSSRGALGGAPAPGAA